MKFAITGGAGFIGSHLTRHLLKEGHETIVLDNLHRGSKENLDDVINKVRFFNVNILEKEKLLNILDKEDVDGIFHQAALTSVPESYEHTEEYERVNVSGTENIFKVAKELGLKVVYASSSSVYGNPESIPITENSKLNPINPYGKTKLQDEVLAERYCKEEGVRIIGLRYFNVYGPGQNPAYAGVISKFYDRLTIGESPIIFGDGSQIRDFVSVEDVAQANLASFESITDNAFINIGSGIPTSIKDLAEIMINLSGKTALKPIYDKLPPGDVKKSLADTTLAKELIGWDAKIKLANGLQKYFFPATC